MTIHEYVQSVQNTDKLVYSAVTKRIRGSKSIPNVRDYSKFGSVYKLNVEISENN